MKTKSTLSSAPTLATDLSGDYLHNAERVFSEKNGKILIGGQEIDSTTLSILRDEAKLFSTTSLFEILNSTIINEAFAIALIQSKNFDEVTSAKMLYHWNFVLQNMVYKLTK